MTSPLVSVVLPSYQHARFVRRAVESVLAQTVSDLELLVVDDASTDGTPDIVSQIDDPRLRLIRLAENRREHARNVGLGLARGRYVAFQNSDDEWHPEKLARQLAVLETRADIGASFTEVRIIDAEGREAANTWASTLFCDGNVKRSSSDWLRLLFTRNCLCITSALVRHDLIERVGFFRPSLLQSSDWDMWVRLAAVSELDVVPQRLTSMRVDGDRNLSAPNPRTASRSLLEMVDVLENYARPPIVERLPELFPDAGLDASRDPLVMLSLFARFAALEGGMAHRLLADRVLATLIDDPEGNRKLAAAFGGKAVKFFWENRTGLVGARE